MSWLNRFNEFLDKSQCIVFLRSGSAVTAEMPDGETYLQIPPATAGLAIDKLIEMQEALVAAREFLQSGTAETRQTLQDTLDVVDYIEDDDEWDTIEETEQ